MAEYVTPENIQEESYYRCTECSWEDLGDELIDHGDDDMCCPECGSKYVENNF